MARGFNRSNADGAQGHTAPAWRCGQVLKGNLRAIAAFVAAAKFRLPTMCLTRSTTALPLILASILTRPAWSQSIQFTDVSVAAGLGGFNFTPNTLAVPGLNEWIMGGIGVGDFNGDGWPDLFIPRGGSGTDRLYINLGNGTFENQAVAWGIAQAHAGNGVACGDFDRDGDIDIYVSSYGTAQDNLGQIGRHRLYRNDGGFFTEVAVAFGVHVSAPTGSVANGAAWGDFDLDGDLDLAVAGWSSVHTGNRLFRNDGHVFVDVTPAPLLSGPTWGFQPALVDITGDGFPELLIAADFESGRAFRNLRNGTFQLTTQAMGLGLDDNGMGHAIGDFNRDGLPDYYVTSIHMNVPNSGMYNGNTLYINQGPNGGQGHVGFVEAAAARGCSDGGWGWGVVAVDLDHDGWEDIVETNGRNASQWANELEYVFRNLGDGFFHRLGAESGIALAADARGLATLDYDRDGDMDVVMIVNNGPLKLYRNDSVKIGGWLQVELHADRAGRCAPHGLGAVVECAINGVVQRRWLHSGSSYNASSEYLAHFGLPTMKGDLSVRIDWPSGQTTLLEAVAPNQRLVVGAPQRSDLDADGFVDGSDLAALFAVWRGSDLANRAMRAADLDGDGIVGPRDLSILLSDWSR
jgi:hypothetical protein